MIQKATICIIILVAARLGQGSQVSELCKEANLDSFLVSNVDGLQDSHDYCLEAAPPKPVAVVIKKIIKQNAKVSAFFKSNNKTFYKKPVSFSLEGKALAAIDSYGYPWLTGYVLRLGTFKSWSGEVYFDPAIYTHELGHLLPQIADPNIVPSSLRFHQRNPILFEGFCDFLALAIQGQNVTPTNRFESFILNFRETKLDDSYSRQGGFFRSEYTMRTLHEGCQKYISDGGQSEDTLVACKKIETDTGGLFPPFDTNPLNPKHWAGYDDHRLGVPFNSFMLNFGQKTSKDTYSIMMDAYKTPGGTAPIRKCGLYSSVEDTDFIKISFPTFSGILKPLEENLSKVDLKTFQSLFRYHAIDIATEFSVIYESGDENIINFAKGEIVHNMEAEKNTFFSKTNPCYDILTISNPLPPDSCTVSCTIE